MPLCPGCGATVQESTGPTHKYFGEHPGCWEIYGEILAREFESREYWKVHRLTVDCYAVQHPNNQDRRNIQSVNIHLMALYAILEINQDFKKIPPLLSTAANRLKGTFEFLDPPKTLGSINVNQVHSASNAREHCAIVHQWSESVWKAWSRHHKHVAELYRKVIEIR